MLRTSPVGTSPSHELYVFVVIFANNMVYIESTKSRSLRASAYDQGM